MKIIGLIPARKGSKRIPGKNMALLNKKPLLYYTLKSSVHTGIFSKIVVSTDWEKVLVYMATRSSLPVSSPFDVITRPAKLCTDESHDYQWVKHALDCNPGFDLFAILRPTSPFRTADTIRRAFAEFDSSYDSLRAIEPTKHHPHKSWEIEDGGLSPFFPKWSICGGRSISDFDLPTQLLPEIYCQNACIHIAKTEVLEKFKNVSGEIIKPFFTEGDEGIDINTPEDLEYAEWIMRGRR